MSINIYIYLFVSTVGPSQPWSQGLCSSELWLSVLAETQADAQRWLLLTFHTTDIQIPIGCVSEPNRKERSIVRRNSKQPSDRFTHFLSIGCDG